MQTPLLPLLADDEIKAMAIAAGALEMRENVLNAPSIPWGCEFEIDQLRVFVGSVAARAVEAARLPACGQSGERSERRLTAGLDAAQATERE